jgi:serine/threonine-protein phosphatase 5
MQEFLAANGLRLIIRSHEGPDARFERADLPDMAQGFAIDHVTPAGRLVTVFSAPDYPQFQVRPC